MREKSNRLLMGEPKLEHLYNRSEEIDWLQSPLEIVHKHIVRCLENSNADLVVVQERKGRALLRGLIDEYKHKPLKWEWSKVLSSNAIDNVDPKYFANKKILIFDDTLRTGAHIIDLIRDLSLKNVQAHNLSVCVIGAHQEGSAAITEIERRGIPLWSYFKNLATYDFHILRSSLVDEIRHLGSLMLDTEHVEFRFKSSSASFREVVDALGRNAETVVFDSGRKIKNITVYYGDTDRTHLSEEDFPNCGFTRIVKKCRVIRYSEREYTIIPLCLPSVPSEGFAWKDGSWQLDLFGGRQPQNHVECFYQVGLIASLEVMTWAIKDLSAALGGGIIYKFPLSHTKGTRSGYDFSHLLPIYPTLDCKALAKQVSKKAKTAENSGSKLHQNKAISSKRKMAWNDDYITADRLDSDALKLIQSVGNELRNREAIAELMGTDIPDQTSHGLRASEVFDMGKKLALKESEVSAIFDWLIDTATLVTKIETQKTEGGSRCVRTFKPDGEIVSRWVSTFTREWGLPYEMMSH